MPTHIPTRSPMASAGPDYEFFPPIEPYARGMLRVDDIHTLYWEECGNPDGVPVVFLHGGPGAGATPTHRRFFDPRTWRIMIFDQRGAGRSLPLAETRQNTTELLVADIEALRQHRDIQRWHVFGGSWGSTLALAYAEAHPAQCLGLMLRGICLMRRSEVDWFLYGIRSVFPEAWEKFANLVAPHERSDLLSAYIRMFQSDDHEVRLKAVRRWSQYEGACSTLRPSPESAIGLQGDQHHVGLAIMEAHYFKNNLFTPDAQLLLNVGAIRRIPGFIVQGRYDMVCPIVTANDLHMAWPEADYRVVHDAGHSALEPGIRQALIEATERFKVLRG